MTIEFRSSGSVATPAAVEAVESRLGSSLPAEFRNLLSTAGNGGYVESVGVGEVGLVALFGVERGDDLDVEQRLTLSQDRVAPGLLPVADAEGGNLVCLSLRPRDFGAVWFWDHEMELVGDACSPVAADFAEFLALLGPGDESTDDLPTVISSWIDPAFQAELEAKKATE